MLSVTLFDGVGGANILSLDGIIADLSFSTGVRGFEECRIRLIVDRSDRRRLLQRGGMPHVEITDQCAVTVWSGRVERIALQKDTVTLIARGYYAALDDSTITSFYAMSDAGKFKPFHLGLFAGGLFNSGWWVLESDDNGLYISPRKGETHGGSSNIGALYWLAPHLGNEIYSVTYTYEFYAPAGWQAIVHGFDYTPSAAMTFVTSPWTLGGTGAVQTGTTTQTFGSSVQALSFSVRNTNPAAVLGVDTGTYYLRITGITVWAIQSDIDTGAVVRDLISTASAVSTNQLSSATVGVFAGKTTYDCVFNNTPYTDALAFVSAPGDTSNKEIEYFVADDRALIYQRRGLYNRVWYIDESDFSLERGMEDVRNTIRSSYKDSFGNEVYTDAVVDNYSVEYWGLTRSVRVKSGGVTSATATNVATTQVSILGQAVPSASMTIASVSDASGMRYPAYVLRANDIVVVRNIEYGSEDTINSFYVAHTQYSAMSDSMTVELDVPQTTSAVFVGGQLTAIGARSIGQQNPFFLANEIG